MLAACAALLLVFAVPRAAQARHRLARLFRAQEEWAEMMDCHAQPRRQCPLAGRGAGLDRPQLLG